MINHPTKEQLYRLLQSSASLQEKLAGSTRLTGLFLQADRCFLYLRHPEAAKGRIEFCWCAHKDIPDVTQQVWQLDIDLPEQDPLFGAALSLQPSVFVDDIYNTPESVLNVQFEEETFGHRALIHAHIQHEDKLWGILQPAVWNHPRKWTADEEDFIKELLPWLGPLVKEYVESKGLL